MTSNETVDSPVLSTCLSVAFLALETVPKKSMPLDYKKSPDSKIVAAAFGLRYSSWVCGFSTRGTWSDVKTINWCSSRLNVSNTLPSSLLLNPDKSFKAFGYEAQEQFSRLKGGRSMEFYFFQEIMSVFDSQKAFSQHTIQRDITGKEIESTTLFERAFNFLFAKFTRSISCNRLKIRETDLKFVIILPTHFSKNEQQFVYETAVKGGISLTSLIIVLETEAAFFYYQCTVTKRNYEEKEVPVGKKYLVACLGEKTSTLSVNKKSSDGSSDEILRISKGSWGMQSLLDDFHTCMEEIVGKQQMQALKKDISDDYTDFTEDFKRKFKTMRNVQRLQVSIPSSILQWVEDHTLSSVEQHISSSEYSEKIQMICDKMRWSKDGISLICDKTIKRTIEHIKTIIVSDMVDIETILLCGSLSECIVVQDAVKEFFSTKRVFALNENAVLSGAVHIRHAISCEDC